MLAKLTKGAVLATAAAGMIALGAPMANAATVEHSDPAPVAANNTSVLSDILSGNNVGVNVCGVNVDVLSFLLGGGQASEVKCENAGNTGPVEVSGY